MKYISLVPLILFFLKVSNYFINFRVKSDYFSRKQRYTRDAF